MTEKTARSRANLQGEIDGAALYRTMAKVEKNPDMVTYEIRNALELPNICFMGSNVISGSATAVVVNTGSLTYFGGIISRHFLC
jgi:Mg2+-importing ATPase